MKKWAENINKTLYAALFLLLVPALLWLWARYTEEFIDLPVLGTANAAWVLLIGGTLLMAWSMYYLKKYGKGLPMNAYPPPSMLVNKGPYKLFRHPIYWGFGFFIIGYFIKVNSASGLWMVAPITILSMIALVWGFEAIDLRKRFPDQSVRTILDLPIDSEDPVTVRERIVSIFLLGLTLLLSNYMVYNLVGHVEAGFGSPLALSFTFETQYLSLLMLLFLLITSLLLKSKAQLRNWVITSLVAFGISTFAALFYPSIAAQYLLPESYAVYTVPVFLMLISLRSLFKRSVTMAFLMAVVALLLIILQLSLSRSALLNLTMSIGIYLVAANYFQLWIFLKNGSEKIANSWKEWSFGKVRVINHGFYVGFGSFLGILLTGILLGDAYAWAILVFAIIVIVFSALWAQVIEGSEKLKRPYGFYGALVGIIFASIAVWAMGFNVWVLIGGISVVMPWVQGIGRFRCLINGCCHGDKVEDPNIGIRYFHHRSRVCGISDLKGELLHPTPLYSMIWLFVVGFVLLALWKKDFSPPFIFGLYLILNGIGRFVEEAYRGEVQTPSMRGLRLYQWTAIISVLVGIIMTFLKVDITMIESDFGWQSLLSAIIGGLLTTFAMGVDFPQSNARFSRLV